MRSYPLNKMRVKNFFSLRDTCLSFLREAWFSGLLDSGVNSGHRRATPHAFAGAWLYPLLCAGCYVLCAGCAPVGSSSLEQRVEQQDIQLRQMQAQQADTWNELQAMKQERDNLKGQLDALNNAGGAQAIAQRVRQHDAALRKVDNSMALDLPLGAPLPEQTTAQPALTQPTPAGAGATAPLATGAPAPGIGIAAGNAPDSSAYAQPPAQAPAQAPQGSYGLPPDPVQTPAEAPSDEKWGQADPKPEQPAPQKDISLALFDAGLNDFHARNYQAAERSFRDFIKNYPKHTQTAEAQYYLGECAFMRNKYPEAALAYDDVIKKYPKSGSAPGAYLKQAICFSKMKQPAAAKMQMQAVIKKYPNSPEAARAKTFLKTNK